MYKNASFLLLLLLLASLASPASAADVYKCTDAGGKTYYSGQRCPSSEQGTRLRVQRPATSSEENTKETGDGKTLEQRIAEADDPVRKAQLELLKKECELARTQLSRYEDAPYLVEKKDDGTQRRLSDEETAAEKARLGRKIKEQCK